MKSFSPPTELGPVLKVQDTSFVVAFILGLGALIVLPFMSDNALRPKQGSLTPSHVRLGLEVISCVVALIGTWRRSFEFDPDARVARYKSSFLFVIPMSRAVIKFEDIRYIDISARSSESGGGNVHGIDGRDRGTTGGGGTQLFLMTEDRREYKIMASGSRMAVVEMADRISKMTGARIT